jgi:hypothetical protein
MILSNKHIVGCSPTICSLDKRKEREDEVGKRKWEERERSELLSDSRRVGYFFLFSRGHVFVFCRVSTHVNATRLAIVAVGCHASRITHHNS